MALGQMTMTFVYSAGYLRATAMQLVEKNGNKDMINVSEFELMFQQ